MARKCATSMPIVLLVSAILLALRLFSPLSHTHIERHGTGAVQISAPCAACEFESTQALEASAAITLEAKRLPDIRIVTPKTIETPTTGETLSALLRGPPVLS